METNRHRQKRTKKEGGTTVRAEREGSRKKPASPNIFYKTSGNKITIRRPRESSDYISFTITDSTRLSGNKIKTFLKYLITDIRELNFLKNDVGFLLNELYGEEHSIDQN